MKDSIIKKQEIHNATFDDSKYFQCKTCKRTDIPNLSTESRRLGECHRCRRNPYEYCSTGIEEIIKIDRHQRLLLAEMNL